MSPSTYALVALFAMVSTAAGMLAARVVRPRRPWSWLVPAIAAFGALYVVGHRLAMSIGPEIGPFGWEVALPFDLVVAVAVALAAALAHASVMRLLQSQEARPGRDRLA